MSSCKKCNRELYPDEIGIYKRIINRGATEYLCLSCLAETLGCSEELLLQKIRHFRNMGCLLFSQEPKD